MYCMHAVERADTGTSFLTAPSAYAKEILEPGWNLGDFWNAETAGASHMLIRADQNCANVDHLPEISYVVACKHDDTEGRFDLG